MAINIGSGVNIGPGIGIAFGGGAGNDGAVCIIWDYTGAGTRTFPSTLTTDL
jgi:hypothetical protein